MGANYSVYKLPYISSAISINTENLKTCLAKASPSSTPELRACITNNISSISNTTNATNAKNLHVTYFGTGESVNIKNGKTTITNANYLPNSNCLENFDSNNNNTNIESKKLFCFNGTFTILTIFVLLLLLIFININYKNSTDK